MQIKTKKAQQAIEALMIFSVSLLFMIPLILIFYSSTNLRAETLNSYESKAFLQQLSDSAGEVWYEGAGARKTIFVNYPTDMHNISLSGDSILCISTTTGIACDPAIKKLGREISIEIEPSSGTKSKMVIMTPAPLKNNYTHDSQRLDWINTNGEINSGLVVLVLKNIEGKYVNVVRYSPQVPDY
jgi:hypothetical protein